MLWHFVRLAVTRRYLVETAKRIPSKVFLLSALRSPTILVFPYQPKIMVVFRREHGMHGV